MVNNMKELLILGRFITNKQQVMQLIADLCKHSDTSMEQCVAVCEVEQILVKAGFLDYEEVEQAEVMCI